MREREREKERERKYGRPLLIPLDSGCDYASGYCGTGGSNTCDTGIGVKSGLGGQCLGGQYARTCATGTGENTQNCQKGNQAVGFCTSEGQKATMGCTTGDRARGGSCGTGSSVKV